LSEKDVYNAARLADYLPNMDLITGPLTPSADPIAPSQLQQMLAMPEGWRARNQEAPALRFCARMGQRVLRLLGILF
jgi:hypothetical protein